MLRLLYLVLLMSFPTHGNRRRLSHFSSLTVHTQLSKLQDEVLLFSIAILNSPKAAARVSGGKGQDGDEGGRVIGGDFAEELEESLTREERHIRACRFVAGVHR